MMDHFAFRLTELEKTSAAWTRLRAYLEERLQVLREKNDTSLDVAETARLRGKIEMVKHILDAGVSPDTFPGD